MIQRLATSTGLTVAIGLLLLTALAVLAGQNPRHDGGRLIVAGGDGQNRNNPAVGMNEAGRYVVAWDGPGNGDADGIFARVYDERGLPLTAEFRVNTTTANVQQRPRASMDEAGNFVVVWEAVNGSSGAVSARVFGGRGNARTAELPISSTALQPDVASFRDGRFVLSWSSPSGPSKARWYTAAGVARTGEIEIDPSTPTYYAPRVTVDATGIATIAWEGGAGGLFAKYARRFDQAGVALGSSFQLGGSYLVGEQAGTNGDVSANGDGAYVTTAGTYDVYFEVNRIRTRRIAAPGDSTVSADAKVWEASCCKSDSTVALDARGNYVVAWGGSWGNNILRQFQTDGTPQGDSAYLDQDVPPPWGSDRWPALGIGARGDYTVAYERSEYGATTRNIFTRRYCANLSATDPVTRTACVGGSAFFSTEATGRMPVTYQWRKDGVALVDDSHVHGSRSATLVLDPVVSGDAGSYDCVIGDACPTAATISTLPATLSLSSGAALGRVTNLRLRKVAGGQISLTWNDVAGATDYVVYEDRFPDTGFIHVVGTATSGATGLTLTPPKDHRQYRVAARNAACGAARPD